MKKQYSKPQIEIVEVATEGKVCDMLSTSYISGPKEDTPQEGVINSDIDPWGF